MYPSSEWNAGLYDDKHSFVWKMAVALLDLLEAKPGDLILDVGCGTGHLTAKIAGTGATVLGIDRSPEMVRQARENYPALSFEVLDVREIRFQKKFDAVFSNATLHWIKEPEPAIRGIGRALRPGGRFVTEFGGKGNIRGLLAAVERAWRKLGLEGAPPDPWYYPSVAEYSSLLEGNGFETSYAMLCDRPTPLDGGETGLHDWLCMFGGALVRDLAVEKQAKLFRAIEQEARTELFRGGQWILDYRRLRLAARLARLLPSQWQ